MEEDVVVVLVSGVRDEVFDGFWGGFWEEADCYVAVGCVEGCCGACGGGFGGLLGLALIGGSRFFVVDVALGFGDAVCGLSSGENWRLGGGCLLVIVCEHVETDFS